MQPSSRGSRLSRAVDDFAQGQELILAELTRDRSATGGCAR
ncbi:hypothetical protein [Streptomyces puniciscabiei]